MTLHDSQRRGGIGGGQDDVPLGLEGAATECQYGGLVLDDQDRLATAGRPALLGTGRDVGWRGDPRQIDLEARAVTRLRVDGDVAAALLDDAVHRGEAEPCSLADFLGRKERLEEMGADA